MRILESEPGVEAMRAGALPVARQLHEAAVALARDLDRAFHQPLADAAPAQRAVDAHGLDVRAPGAAAAEAGDERQLQHADHAPVEFRDQQQLVRVAIDRVERAAVRGIVAAGRLIAYIGGIEEF